MADAAAEAAKSEPYVRTNTGTSENFKLVLHGATLLCWCKEVSALCGNKLRIVKELPVEWVTFCCDSRHEEELQQRSNAIPKAAPKYNLLLPSLVQYMQSIDEQLANNYPKIKSQIFVKQLYQYLSSIQYYCRMFLQSYGFQNTLTTFSKEAEELGFDVTVPTAKDRISKETLTEILNNFTSRDMNKFFKVWELHIPETIQQGMEYKKLTFYLHVYFAVLPLKKAASDSILGNEEKSEDTGMEALRQFLETKGTEFSAESEFLPYYALPFVNNPLQHPSFQELFTEKWMKQLADNLQQFLFEHTWGNAVAPRLMLIESNDLCITDSQLSSNLQSVEVNTAYKQLKRRYQKLHKDHHNLIGVAAELTEALENSVKGQAVDLKATLNNCTNIFPDLFTHANQTEDIESETTPEEIIKRSIAQTKEDHANSTGFDLDFRKIKQHLTSGSVKTKLLLFQALRWRITQSAPEDRECVASSYLRHDILSLHPGSANSSHKNDSLPLAAHFAPPHAATPHPLQQAAARLVNTLASLRCGRDYLSSAGFGLIRILVSALHGDKGIKLDPFSKDMIVATLQKLSLRHRQRIGMIEAGLVEWLIQRLVAEGLNMKSYALEYSTALLMNLCLHRRAKERCVPQARVILHLLTGLLGSEIKQAIPYVNGTLYSLLAHPSINQEAKHMGLCGVLEFYLKNSEGEMHRQLEYILRLHRGDCQPDSGAASDEENADDDTEEVDLIEEELDSDDPVRSLNGDLHGEELLKQQYRLLFPYHGVVHPSTSLQQQQSGELLVRPTTPHFTSRNSQQSRLQHSSNNQATIKLNTGNYSAQQSEELMLESFDSEIGKNEDDNEDEEETVVIIGDLPITSECGATENNHAASESDDLGDLPPTPVQTSKDGTDTTTEAIQEANQQCKDGEDEYAKAFSSRPRIPRTPTFQANRH